MLVRPQLRPGHAGLEVLKNGAFVAQRRVRRRQKAQPAPQAAAIDQHPRMATGFCQRRVGLPGGPGVHRALGQGQLGVCGGDEAQLNVVDAQAHRGQRLEGDEVANGAAVGGDTFALEAGRVFER